MINGNPSSTTFKRFFEDWVDRGQYLLNELLSTQTHYRRLSEDDISGVIARMISHYEQYYEEKSRATRKDVFAMFSPSWFSTYERTYLWIAGFKPGIPFKLVNKYIADLSEEQLQRMNTFRAEMGTRERILTNELAQVQESVASSYLVGLGRRQVEEREERRQVDEAVGEMKEMMVTLVQSADLLRMTIVKGIVEILRPVQCVKFLATAAQLHFRIRMIGLEKDASRNRGSRT